MIRFERLERYDGSVRCFWEQNDGSLRVVATSAVSNPQSFTDWKIQPDAKVANQLGETVYAQAIHVAYLAAMHACVLRDLLSQPESLAVKDKP